MHPLVRWQFRGGIAERDRKAFLFTNVHDSKGKHYDIPVRVWGLSVTTDQQLAGAIMKTGGSIFLWSIIVFLFFRRRCRFVVICLCLTFLPEKFCNDRISSFVG